MEIRTWLSLDSEANVCVARFPSLLSALMLARGRIGLCGCFKVPDFKTEGGCLLSEMLLKVGASGWEGLQVWDGGVI